MVSKSGWVPDRGDVVWLDFDPRAGSEQAGRRPALVISPKIYNRKVGLALFSLITSARKNYPFEVCLPAGLKASGVILADHIKSLDWRARNAEYLDKVPDIIMDEVLAKLAALLT